MTKQTNLATHWFFVGLMMTAWSLYTVSLFLPAANLLTPLGDRPFASGGDILWGIFLPPSWILVYPFFYMLVNCVYLFSLGTFWRRFRGQPQKLYTLLLLMGCSTTWFAPYIVEQVAVGYYLWMASFHVAALAFLLPLKETIDGSMPNQT